MLTKRSPMSPATQLFFTGAASLALSLTVALPGALRAQEVADIKISGNVPPEMQAKLKDLALDAFRKGQAAKRLRTAKLSPTLLTADPAKGTATFELANHSDDTLQVSLYVSSESRYIDPADTAKAEMSPEAAEYIKSKGGLKALTTEQGKQKQSGNPLLEDGGESSSEPEMVRIDEKESMASWITGVPKQVTLLPRQKKSISVNIAKPANTKAGKYAAWLIAVTNLSEVKGNMTADQGLKIQFPAFPVFKNELQSSAKLELLVNQ